MGNNASSELPMPTADHHHHVVTVGDEFQPVGGEDENGYVVHHHVYEHQHAHTQTSETEGQTPLHAAARRGASPEELDQLVSMGYDVDAPDVMGVTPLHVAAFFGREVASKWLLERGRAAWMKDVEGLSPADYARDQRHFDLARFIERRVSELDPREQERKRAQQVEREIKAAEIDKLRAMVEALRASERRARAELERETREKVRLLVGASLTPSSLLRSGSSVSESALEDLESKVVGYKTARDVMAAELKMVEVAVAAVELAVFGAVAPDPAPGEEMTLYLRLMRCAREVARGRGHAPHASSLSPSS